MAHSLHPSRLGASTRTPSAAVVDPRGPRFAAAITTIVLAIVLVLYATPEGFVLLVLQTAVFTLGAFVGPRSTPYSIVFRRWVRPRLGPPAELEDVRPLRFAQLLGLAFSLIGLVGLALVPILGVLAVAAALAAAFLNAAFGYCLGCELYLLLRRAVPAASTH
jgi:Domain of unknown function (DUF4395)